MFLLCHTLYELKEIKVIIIIVAGKWGEKDFNPCANRQYSSQPAPLCKMNRALIFRRIYSLFFRKRRTLISLQRQAGWFEYFLFVHTVRYLFRRHQSNQIRATICADPVQTADTGMDFFLFCLETRKTF